MVEVEACALLYFIAVYSVKSDENCHGVNHVESLLRILRRVLCADGETVPTQSQRPCPIRHFFAAVAKPSRGHDTLATASL